MVDLHWCLEAVAGFYRLPYSRLREKALSWDYQGQQVKVLAPEHLLMHLCLHLYDELLDALRLVDLGLVLCRLPLNWNLFLDEVTRFRCQAPIAIMLSD